MASGNGRRDDEKAYEKRSFPRGRSETRNKGMGKKDTFYGMGEERVVNLAVLHANTT